MRPADPPLIDPLTAALLQHNYAQALIPNPSIAFLLSLRNCQYTPGTTSGCC